MFQKKITEIIGNTPIVEISSLSKLAGKAIWIKCEHLNPGGSIKDRAALQMVEDAFTQGILKPGMTVVEGTAGNTGIGLSLVASSFGLKSVVVMPEGQAPEKERLIQLFGGELILVKPTKFQDPEHFYHRAKRIAEENPNEYWWANQFENLSNFRAHYERTGPEIYRDLGNSLTHIVSVAGTGGTIGGVSKYLKEKNPKIHVSLIDPEGSGLHSYLTKGEFQAEGSSFSEGIGIMRLTENFKQAKVDESFSLPDIDAVIISQYVKQQDGIVLGTSAALNVAAAFKVALSKTSAKEVLTFWCDLGERSFSKLYNAEFLASKGIALEALSIESLIEKYRI